MTKARWTTGALAVLATVGLALSVAPAANAAGTRTESVSCTVSSGWVGYTLTAKSGGTSASTSISGTKCTDRLGVKATYRRDVGQQTYPTAWVYTYGGSSTSVNPGYVLSGTHSYRLKSGLNVTITT